MKKLIILLSVSLMMFVLAGCDSLGLNGGGTGELVMYIADAPVNDVVHVNVTLDKVDVHSVETGWITINDFKDKPNGELTVDLLTLRFDEQLLGQQSLPAGTYDQIRLHVATEEAPDDVSVGQNMPTGKSYVEYYDSSETLKQDNIFIPSGTQTGLKINKDSEFDGFTIEPGVITRLVLDNDVSKLLVNAGKSGLIILEPTAIKVIDKVISGDIQGQVLADADGNSVVLEDSDVVVEALDTYGEVIASTVASTTIDDTTGTPAGSFLLRGLLEGTYTVRAYVVDENGEIDETTYTAVEEPGISVVAGQLTTLDNPLILQKNIQ